MTEQQREFLPCPTCSCDAPIHRDLEHRKVFSRHAWFMTEGRDPGSAGRCPGSLRAVEDEMAVVRSPKQGGHL